MFKGRTLDAVEIKSPFVLRTVAPAVDELLGRQVRRVARLGKRIVFSLEGDLFVVIHLMIAGRFKWKDQRTSPAGEAVFHFSSGSLILTEAAKKKRASVHLVSGPDDLAKHNPGGLEPLEISQEQFADRLREKNHTIKRALTDPRILSGIGNAYSDEILHHAKLSPVVWTSRLSDEELGHLHKSTQHVLRLWVQRLSDEAGDRFPTKVTAFREEMAVHGKFNKPCPVCTTPVARIRFASRETNYCPRCQTGGKLLADRSLSRLLKKDWPKSLEELEALKLKIGTGK